jgi:hypothetical protein
MCPVVAALLAVLSTPGIAQDLNRPIGAPGELRKAMPEEARTPSGTLPAPPPPPARPELGEAVDHADAAALRMAWLRTQPPGIKLITPAPLDEWTEGDEAELTWETSGPIESVRIYYYGGRCRLGGHDRGTFEGFITQQAENTGRLRWEVPWIDALSLNVTIAALAENGEKLATDERIVRFRPRFMRNLKQGTLIAVSKSAQRLYYQRDGRIVRQHIISTAMGGFWTPTMHPGSYDPYRGEMGRVFYKDPDAYSHLYHCHMLWWLAITESGSHGIHATSPGFYEDLGGPASHGCIRQHRADARVLYDMVAVGTPVYVFP